MKRKQTLDERATAIEAAITEIRNETPKLVERVAAKWGVEVKTMQKIGGFFNQVKV